MSGEREKARETVLVTKAKVKEARDVAKAKEARATIATTERAKAARDVVTPETTEALGLELRLLITKGALVF